jgi:hypothetical protein
VVTHAYNPSTQEAKTEGSQVQGQVGLQEGNTKDLLMVIK